VADVLDLSEMEIVAKVGELDRANLREGQDVKFLLDAIPDETFHGKIKGMSGTATANPFGGDPGKKFDVLFSVDMKELMTGLGAKPEEIRKVLETADRNAKKAPAQMPSFAMPGMPGPGGMPGPPGGAPGGMTAAGPPGGMPRPPAGGGDDQRAAMMAKMMEQLPAQAKK